MTKPSQEKAPRSADLEIMPSSALHALESAQIDTQIATARKFPRGDLATIRQNMENFALLDDETAESCFYSLRRRQRQEDGSYEMKTITGPSVRLAEIALVCYKNCRAGARPIENNGRVLTAQGVCFDLENNVAVSVEVGRRISTADGRTYSEDMQLVVMNAANSVAFRNAVFKIVPGALIQPVFDKCREVVMGTLKTLSEKREKYMKRLEQLGASRERVLYALGRPNIEAVTLADLEQLVGVGTAIAQGEQTVEEAFPPIASAKQSEKPSGTQDAAKAAAEEKLQKLQEEQQKEAEKTDQPTKPADPEPAEFKNEPTVDLGEVSELPEAGQYPDGTVCQYNGKLLTVVEGGWKNIAKTTSDSQPQAEQAKEQGKLYDFRKRDRP